MGEQGSHYGERIGDGKSSTPVLYKELLSEGLGTATKYPFPTLWDRGQNLFNKTRMSES